MILARLIALLLSILVAGFSCFSVKYVIVQMPPRGGITIDTLWDDYSKVVTIVGEWARERGVTAVDCGAFNTARVASPACHGFEFGPTRISVLFEPSERRTTVEIFEGGVSQSSQSKQAQMELRARFVSAFGEERVRDARW